MPTEKRVGLFVFHLAFLILLVLKHKEQESGVPKEKGDIVTIVVAYVVGQEALVVVDPLQ